MDNKFDELTKSMAQSVTRRAALKRFGVGLAGMALACFGLAKEANAGGSADSLKCKVDNDCPPNLPVCCHRTRTKGAGDCRAIC